MLCVEVHHMQHIYTEPEPPGTSLEAAHVMAKDFRKVKHRLGYSILDLCQQTCQRRYGSLTNCTANKMWSIFVLKKKTQTNNITTFFFVRPHLYTKRITCKIPPHSTSSCLGLPTRADPEVTTQGHFNS